MLNVTQGKPFRELGNEQSESLRFLSIPPRSLKMFLGEVVRQKSVRKLGLSAIH